MTDGAIVSVGANVCATVGLSDGLSVEFRTGCAETPPRSARAAARAAARTCIALAEPGTL